MKKLILLICTCMVVAIGFAQEMSFETGTWAEALEKAKKENRYIFVEVCTSWCGPCKRVAKDVFTQKAIIHFYNNTFINYKIDAEKGEGPKFVKQYPVTGYPTFFYINGDGEVMYTFSGAKEDVYVYIEEAKKAPICGRHNGLKAMQQAVENGSTDSKLLYDYYQIVKTEDKPLALNLYLKSLSSDELVSPNNRLIEKIGAYDNILMTRLVEEIVKACDDENITKNEEKVYYFVEIISSIERNLSSNFEKSIKDGNLELFNELLILKEKMNQCNKQSIIYSRRPISDLYIVKRKGEFYATPEYLNFALWSTNRTNPEQFKKQFPDYMAKLMKENPVDTLLNKPAIQERVKYIKKNVSLENKLFNISELFEEYCVATNHILDEAGYFWCISPSDAKTKQLCAQWIEYICKINPYNATLSLAAVDMLARINNKLAISIMEGSLKAQQEIENNDLKLLRDIKNKLQDLRNNKL